MGLLNLNLRVDHAPKGPRGSRAYAVGDIHGRRDLLELLLSEIERDLEARPRRKTLLIFLGDYVDRGRESAQVIERLRTYRHDGVETMFLLGNHEEVVLRILAGESSLVASWLRFGGVEFLESYSLDRADFSHKSNEEVSAILRKTIPRSHVDFLEKCVDSCRFGDYLFVHAGIRPGLPVEQQSQADLRWIREPFLSEETEHGFVVVHGHTITTVPEIRENRIGIDTGAYRSGVLTALALENQQRWWLDTSGGIFDGQPAER